MGSFSIIFHCSLITVHPLPLHVPPFELTRNPVWLFVAAYASLALRLTKFDFNDAIIRGVLFVPLFTKFLTAMHRDAPLGSGRKRGSVGKGGSRWLYMI